MLDTTTRFYIKTQALARTGWQWLRQSFFEREEGQGFFEYIVLIGAGLVVVAAVVALFVAVSGKFSQATGAINGLGGN